MFLSFHSRTQLPKSLQPFRIVLHVFSLFHSTVCSSSFPLSLQSLLSTRFHFSSSFIAIFLDASSIVSASTCCFASFSFSYHLTSHVLLSWFCPSVTFYQLWFVYNYVTRSLVILACLFLSAIALFFLAFYCCLLCLCDCFRVISFGPLLFLL